MRSVLLRVLGVALLVAAVVVFRRLGGFDAAIDALRGLGPWAAPAFVLLHAAAVLALVPSVVPSLAAGGLFGIALGLPVSVLGAGLGAVVALGLGRTLARARIEARFAGDARFLALSRLARERGWKVVALARLTPVFPFTIGNYAFGVTSIPAAHYLGASMLGTIPSNAVYVYLGSVAGELARGEGAGRSGLEWGLLALGGIVTVLLAVYLQRIAKAELERERLESDGPGAPTSAGRGGAPQPDASRSGRR